MQLQMQELVWHASPQVYYGARNMHDRVYKEGE